MRICLISHANAPWTPWFATYFRERGHEIDVVSFHPQPLEGIRVHYVGVASADGRLPNWIYVWRIPRVRRLLRELRPEVVLAPFARSNGLVGAASTRSPLVVSVVGSDRHFDFPFGAGRMAARWLGRRAALFHAVSDELVEDFVALGVPAEKFTVIPVGTDPEQFTPRDGARPPGPVRLICTRKHAPVYDNETLVRALALLRDGGFAFHCRFVGTGESVEATRALVRELDLEGHVELLGEVTHAEVPRQLRWADVYLSASRADGAASSLHEAMSCGVFPVVTDIRANRNWVVQGKTAQLFSPGDAESCARGIRFAWDHPEQAARAATVNRATVIARADRRIGLQRLEALLERAIRLDRNARG